MSASRDVWLLSAVFGVRPGVFWTGGVVGSGTLVYIYESGLPHSLYDYHREYLQQDLQRDVVQNPCDLNHK